MLTRIIAGVLITAAALSAGGPSTVWAQDVRTAEPPAEFPPASFTGKQYVDSRGCVYIRAGIDGNVTWVPRVSRSRQQLCGFEPTLIAGSGADGAGEQPQAEAPSASVELAQDVEIITLPGADAAAPQTSQTGQTGQTSGAADLTAAAQPTAPAVVTTTKPRRSVAAGGAKSAVAPLRRVPASYDDAYRPSAQPLTILSQNRRAPCQGASELSARYINQGANVRCGPQQGGFGNRRSAGGFDDATRVMPKHVYETRLQSQDLSVPEGYRRVWQDGRLNPRRAEMSLGEVRRLSGRRDVNVVDTDRGAVVLPPSEPIARNRYQDQAQDQAKGQEAVVSQLSTRSAPAATVSEPRYIRAATFADGTAAELAVQRLAERGLPTRLGTVTRNGHPHRVVLVGPFQDVTASQSALRTVRAAGFSGAILRKD
ncbi:SPOR domain-containing protein [Phaeobacter sp.]|uniref:SPOR domain-containing protein n=1 Tax=Phaeobacter sp. TaxID=1902409 RepID=UPI0025FF6C0D|nr:SPOR domain-containing protein [Phaeobacter sp.]